MQTPRAYDIGMSPTAASEKSDSQATVMARIRAALIARGSSLRAWSFAWAEKEGRDPAATYHLARATIARWGDRRDRAPKGVLGRAILRALREELGADVVPPCPDELPRRPAAGIPEDRP